MKIISFLVLIIMWSLLKVKLSTNHTVLQKKNSLSVFKHFANPLQEFLMFLQ